MSKILWIDDVPDEKIADTTIEAILSKVYAGSEYELLIEKDPDKAMVLIKKDPDIKLILLDTWFGTLKLGPTLADRIAAVTKNSNLFIIALTSEAFQDGGTASAQRKNVRKYLEKSKLAHKITQDRLYNLSDALIKDPTNEQWNFSFDFDEDRFYLTNTRTNENFDILVPNKGQLRPIISLIIDECHATGLRAPFDLNKLTKSYFPFEHPKKNEYLASEPKDVASIRSKIINAVNERVQEKTDWKTWGILSNSGCKVGYLKLDIGALNSSEADSLPPDIVAELKLEIGELKEELTRVKARLNKLEEGK